MKIAEKIQEKLTEEYRSGMTYKEIAKKHNASYSYVRGLILGTDPASGITLEQLSIMFPELDKAIEHACSGNSGNTNIVNGNGNSGVTQTIGGGDLDAYQLRLYQGLASLDIPDDAKAKVLALIKSAAKKD